MTTYAGTAARDVLNGSRNADIIDAGAGDDIINSGAGDDSVLGGDGNDQIHAGSGDDTLVGGAGDDQLNGGGGSDTFVFHFTVLNTPGTAISEDFRGGNLPNGSANASAFGNYLEQLGDWRDGLEAQHGADEDTALGTSVTFTGSTSAIAAKVDVANDYDAETWSQVTGRTLSVDNSFDQHTAPVLKIIESEGNDTITAFQDAGPNVDVIELRGLAGLEDAQLDQLFDLQLVDSDGDGRMDASRLTWEGGSIQLGGTTEWGSDVVAFFHDENVHLL